MSRPNVRVLVLESDPAVQAGLRRVRPGGNVTFEFTSLENALAMDAHTVDTVMGDDQILFGPGNTPPLEALKDRLKCPIILMTVFSTPRAVRSALEQGVDVVLPKPFGLAELRRALAQALNIPASPLTTGTALVDPAQGAAESGRINGRTAAAALDFEGRIAGDDAFDALFTELEKRQPLEEGLDSFDVVERHLIRRALQACEGNQSHAARFLGITRNTLRKRIQKYGFASLITKDDDGKE